MSLRAACDFKGCRRARARGEGLTEEGWTRVILPEDSVDDDFYDFCPDHQPPQGNLDSVFEWTRKNTVPWENTVPLKP